MTGHVAAAQAAAAAAAAAKARQIRETVAKTADRGRLALRTAGTSRTEQQQLFGQYTEQLTAATDEARRARAAFEDALRQATQLVQDSPYAGLLRDLGETGDASPRDAAASRCSTLEANADRPTRR
ncbi:hypothetical protein [Streptomyces sp. NBC_00893]|uniref:hypothetical protein n=1 Tax=Streptomyces sp. NBC_00893 TaxID=2975862 RepID=UPI0022530F82|nr:hypothetical protein [Streptomyces sp. NBC_00893]MCX4851632.1 hypothetical protein [Streptomyces sp. NBC_00893]